MDDVIRTNPISSLVRRGAFNGLYFDDKVRIVALGAHWGPGGEEMQNWSFGSFQTREAPLGVDRSNTSIGKYLPDIASLLGTEDIYASQPTDFNALICEEADLTTRIEVDNGRYKTTLHRGAHADGMIVPVGRTFGMSNAGCPAIVLWRKNYNVLCVAHAGMRSLVNDWKLGNRDVPYRYHESVVDEMVHAMGGQKIAQELRALIAFSIPAELLIYHWDHPVYGDLNRLRSEHVANQISERGAPYFLKDSRRMFGLLDLYQIAKAQLMRLGVQEKNIKEIPLQRGMFTTRGEYPKHRNLFLVQHYS